MLMECSILFDGEYYEMAGGVTCIDWNRACLFLSLSKQLKMSHIFFVDVSFCPPVFYLFQWSFVDVSYRLPVCLAVSGILLVCFSVCLSVSMIFCWFVFLFVCLFQLFFVGLSFCLSVCFNGFLLVCLSVFCLNFRLWAKYIYLQKSCVTCCIKKWCFSNNHNLKILFKNFKN